MSLDLTLDLFKQTQRKQVRSESLLKPIVKHFNRHKLLAGALSQANGIQTSSLHPLPSINVTLLCPGAP